MVNAERLSPDPNMCGLFGIVNFDRASLAEARQALATLEHRGPDQWGEWFDDFVYFGHRRLSIQDLSERGRQPFVDDAGNVVAMVNGEIYNALELRGELGADLFTSTSDCESVLHGYGAWGFEGLLERLDGMYALAILDRREKKLFLAKDRFGKKPVYYAVTGGRLVFASEVKAMLQFAPQLKAFSLRGIKTWIGQQGNLSGRTIFSGVYTVGPGECIAVGPELNVRRRRYYDLLDVCLRDPDPPPRPPGQIDEELDGLLHDAICTRLVSDVPVGLQLSGGVDSSILAHRLAGLGRDGMRSYSVGFSEPEFAKFSEEPFSRKVAEQCALRHNAVNVSSEELLEGFERAVWHTDGMLAWPNLLGIMILCLRAKPDVTVLLCGEGADELFAGYRKYLRIAELREYRGSARWLPEAYFSRAARKTPHSQDLWHLYLKKYYGGRPGRLLEHLNSFVSPVSFDFLFGRQEDSLLDGIDRGKLRALPFPRQVIALDHLTYLYSLLDRQDRASMAASVEVRVPFVDRRLVEWAMGLAPADLYDVDETKKPLKRLAAGLYGDDFARRKKQGFPMPMNQWLADPRALGRRVARALQPDFLLYERVDRNRVLAWLDNGGFDHRTVNYTGSDRRWVRWFLTVLRTAQDLFGIERIDD